MIAMKAGVMTMSAAPSSVATAAAIAKLTA